MGLIERGIRLPLTPLSERLEDEVLAAMRAADVYAS
jgi:dihydrodipicolinate synthase/N-acetylneuraminate lyase